ncbi:MAG: flippase-like domain-containing protein [Desulfohalobiaceae bacterium]|nr:flippase-like domain-containing protein [Desulfohalobiaceae bacterium]
MVTKPRGNLLYLAAILLGLVILGLLASLSDIRKLAEIGRGLAPGWILLGSVAAITSFWFFGLCFAALVRRLTKPSAIPDMVKIGYVSFTFSELLVSGGLSGYAVRSIHLAGHGISYLETLIYSLARACIHYLAIFVAFLLTVGLFIPSVPQGIGGKVILFQFLLFAGLLAYALRIFSSSAARNRWVRLAGFLLNTLARLRGREQWFGDPRRRRVEGVMDQAIQAMRSLGWRLIWAFLLDCVGLALRFAALYCAFLACGYSVDPAIMVAGFIIGTFWAFFVQIPGQMGVMEGAVSAVYTTFGIPFEIALIACVLYRLTYSLLPFLVGLVSLPRLTRRTLSSFLRDGSPSPRMESREQD